MIIHQYFTGGNIRVKEIDGDTVVLENDLRDTEIDWFYWAFCVQDARECTLTFRLEEPARMGYRGPAVSHDLQKWHWLDQCDGNSFTYRFGKNEDRVYFAHHMLYHPDRFFAFAQRHGLKVGELCTSPKGRSVPCLHLGEGETSMILTARHHACESTGSFVMEGFLSELLDKPIPNTRVLCVPFVDYDGVINGDQGKARIPHDHNRDYTEAPIYPEVRAIREYADKHGCHYGFDFHSPWHEGGRNNAMYLVRNLPEMQDRFDIFSAILEKEITADAMKYTRANDYPPMTGWNKPNTNFSYTMHGRKECNLAVSLESTYFGTQDNTVTASKLIEFGRCYARSVKKYIEQAN